MASPDDWRLELRLTKYTDYSLRVLIYLAVHPDRRCSIQEIADRYQISKNHLMKVVRQLASAGFIDSVRGVRGGLRLGLDSSAINLAEVIEEMEPDFGMVECLRADNQCVITGPCKLQGLLRQSTQAFLDVMRQQTLADLLSSPECERLEMILVTDP
jgi:Rrf2 family nitric oxide-sensitive transcriptional repressor